MMLVTLIKLAQFSDVGDRILMLVTSFYCCCPTLMLKESDWPKPSPKSPSPKSQGCHQLISSSTSVTNIDVTPRTYHHNRSVTLRSMIGPPWLKSDISVTWPAIVLQKLLRSYGANEWRSNLVPPIKRGRSFDIDCATIGLEVYLSRWLFSKTVKLFKMTV